MKSKLLLSLALMFVTCGQVNADTYLYSHPYTVISCYAKHVKSTASGHGIRRTPLAPMYVVLDGGTLYINFLREEETEVTILTLDGVQIGCYAVSPEENSVTLSYDMPSSFVIQLTIGDVVYEGVVEE